MNEKEFWSNMKRDPATGCLLWTKATSKRGYGNVWFQNKPQKTHRVAWMLKKGAIPEGYDVHHLETCKKSCCEITHLSLLLHPEHSSLTHALGQVDYSKSLARGDTHWSHTHPEKRPHGETHGQAKLTYEQVQEIRELRKHGVILRLIASMFGIHIAQVSRIEKGRSWKDSK